MKDYYTIGARFKGSSKLYTYKVPKEVKLIPHEPCLVNTTTGLSIVCVGEIHDEPQDTMQGVDYRYIAYSLLPVAIPEVKTPENAVTRL